MYLQHILTGVLGIETYTWSCIFCLVDQSLQVLLQAVLLELHIEKRTARPLQLCNVTESGNA